MFSYHARESCCVRTSCLLELTALHLMTLMTVLDVLTGVHVLRFGNTVGQGASSAVLERSESEGVWEAAESTRAPAPVFAVAGTALPADFFWLKSTLTKVV